MNILIVMSVWPLFYVLQGLTFIQVAIRNISQSIVLYWSITIQVITRLLIFGGNQRHLRFSLTSFWVPYFLGFSYLPILLFGEDTSQKAHSLSPYSNFWSLHPFLKPFLQLKGYYPLLGLSGAKVFCYKRFISGAQGVRIRLSPLLGKP